MTERAGDLEEGARNLLVGCAELAAGAHVLIVAEDPALGWYDAKLPEALAETAASLGMAVDMVAVGAPDNRPDPDLAALLDAHDNIVFLARLGDQDRFAAPEPGKRRVMTYVRSAAMLASAYGRTDHRAMTALKQAVNKALTGARNVTITCPRGTHLEGAVSPRQRPEGDVSVRRFPLGVPIPLLADRFSGEVVLADYLTPTGSHVYTPATLALSEPVTARVERGRIAGFDGADGPVAAVAAHYDHVAGLFGIDRDCVHSFHAGIHPAMVYDRPVAQDPDRWSNTAFTDPKYLHFHTCGAYPPGEICWMVADHTTRLDGVALWQDGRLRPERHPATAACLSEHDVLRRLFSRGGP